MRRPQTERFIQFPSAHHFLRDNPAGYAVPMNPRPVFVACFLLGLLPASMPGAAQAQVRRCTTSEGVEAFTDRRCADIGAKERLPREAAVRGGLRLHRTGCSRNLQDLVYELTTAIDARDANRLAGVYHWVGISGSTSAGPHLHFHVADANATLAAEGLPFVFRRFEHLGAYRSLEALLAGEPWIPAPATTPRIRQLQHPAPVGVIDF